MNEILDQYGTAAVQTAAVAVLSVIVWVLFRRFGRRVVRRMGDDAERMQRAETLWAAARKLVAFLLIAVVIGTVFILWDIPVSPLLALGSAVAVAIGFGAQDLVKDVIGGFLILSEDQFRVGDVVTISGVSGEVQEVRLRVTVLRDIEGRVHYVPNGSIEVASNLTHGTSRFVMDIGVSYAADIDRVMEVVADEMAGFRQDRPEWFVSEPELLGVESLADSSVVLRITGEVGPEHRWSVRREGLRRIKNRFDAEGIEIPFPQMVMHRPGDS